MDHDPAFDELLGAAVAGGEWAWVRLMERYGPLLLAYGRAHGSADPDELLSDVMISLLRGIGDFSGDEAAFRAWMFTIARSRVIDAHRRRGRDRSFAVAELPDCAAPEQADTSGLGDLEAAVAALSPRQREVVVLRFVADLSVAEIATVMGARQGAVRVLLHRATRVLHAHITEAGTTDVTPAAWPAVSPTR